MWSRISWFIAELMPVEEKREPESERRLSTGGALFPIRHTSGKSFSHLCHILLSLASKKGHSVLMSVFLEITQAFRLLSCPAAGSPPGLLDLMALRPSGTNVVLVGAELSFFFIAVFSTIVLWGMRRSVPSQRWRRFIGVASVISALYFSIAAVIIGLYASWSVAIADWHVQAVTLVVKGVCSSDAVEADYSQAETMLKNTSPIATWMILLEVLLPIVIIVVRVLFKERAERRSR